jgi:hypothetical protein
LTASAQVKTENHPGGNVAIRTRGRVTRHLIPYLMFIYLLAYLDRANLGVAKQKMKGQISAIRSVKDMR